MMFSRVTFGSDEFHSHFFGALGELPQDTLTVAK
jgi:hypothetical protein